MLKIGKKLNDDCSVNVFLSDRNLNNEKFVVHLSLKNILELIEFEKMYIDTTFEYREEYPFYFVEILYKEVGFLVSFEDFNIFYKKNLEIINRNISIGNMRGRTNKN